MWGFNKKKPLIVAEPRETIGQAKSDFTSAAVASARSVVGAAAADGMKLTGQPRPVEAPKLTLPPKPRTVIAGEVVSWHIAEKNIRVVLPEGFRDNATEFGLWMAVLLVKTQPGTTFTFEEVTVPGVIQLAKTQLADMEPSLQRKVVDELAGVLTLEQLSELVTLRVIRNDAALREAIGRD